MHRLRIVGLLAAALILATPTVGLAWANGSILNMDAYGTHDWILDQALMLADVSWVETTTALLASDDPDPAPADEVANHVFHTTGDRGAPSTVADYYYLTQQAYEAGDYALASELLGVTSHYFADINVPFHTGPTADDLSTHLSYEFAADSRMDAPGENAWYLTPVARTPMTDVHARTVRAAYASRVHYASLISQYAAYGYDSTVESITAACVSRAVNDLADIIQAIETGTGLADAGELELQTATIYVEPGSEVLISATSTDASGTPIEGARVVFAWPLPGGTVYDTAITNAAGVARSRMDIGSAPLMEAIVVTGTVTSGADVAVAEATVIPAYVVGSMRTIVPCALPALDTHLTASTLLLDEDGVPMSGLGVRFTWTQGAVTFEQTTTTDAWGMARSHRIGGFEAGPLVSVTATAHSGGGEASSATSFRFAPSTGGAGVNTRGIAGSDRFSTAAAVSAAAFPDGADVVVVATGLNWPDALGGAALAGAEDAPILLCTTTGLPGVIAAEVERLGASRAIVLGGTGVVGQGVVDDLRDAGVGTVTRVGGTSRYATARAVAQAARSASDEAFERVAFVATGANFPDALAASSISAFRSWPIYLADPAGSPSQLASQMWNDGVREVIVLGGTGVVSSAYEAAFDARFSAVTRLAGTDRYATGVAIAEFGATSAGLDWDGVPIATGTNFPDALAGGVLAARLRSVMLLTDGTQLPASVEDVVRDRRAEIGTIHYLGGTNSVTSAVRDDIEDWFQYLSETSRVW